MELIIFNFKFLIIINFIYSTFSSNLLTLFIVLAITGLDQELPDAKRTKVSGNVGLKTSAEHPPAAVLLPKVPTDPHACIFGHAQWIGTRKHHLANFISATVSNHTGNEGALWRSAALRATRALLFGFTDTSTIGPHLVNDRLELLLKTVIRISVEDVCGNPPLVLSILKALSPWVLKTQEQRSCMPELGGWSTEEAVDECLPRKLVRAVSQLHQAPKLSSYLLAGLFYPENYDKCIKLWKPANYVEGQPLPARLDFHAAVIPIANLVPLVANCDIRLMSACIRVLPTEPVDAPIHTNRANIMKLIVSRVPQLRVLFGYLLAFAGDSRTQTALLACAIFWNANYPVFRKLYEYNLAKDVGENDGVTIQMMVATDWLTTHPLTEFRDVQFINGQSKCNIRENVPEGEMKALFNDFYPVALPESLDKYKQASIRLTFTDVHPYFKNFQTNISSLIGLHSKVLPPSTQAEPAAPAAPAPVALPQSTPLPTLLPPQSPPQLAQEEKVKKRKLLKSVKRVSQFKPGQLDRLVRAGDRRSLAGTCVDNPIEIF